MGRGHLLLPGRELQLQPRRHIGGLRRQVLRFEFVRGQVVQFFLPSALRYFRSPIRTALRRAWPRLWRRKRGPTLKSPRASGSVDDRKNCDLLCVQPVNEAVGWHKQLADRSVTKLRDDLTTFCHLGECRCGVLYLLDESGGVVLRVSCDVFGRSLVGPPRPDPSILLLEPSGHATSRLFMRDRSPLFGSF
jgi:hypothetical protein